MVSANEKGSVAIETSRKRPVASTVGKMPIRTVRVAVFQPAQRPHLCDGPGPHRARFGGSQMVEGNQVQHAKVLSVVPPDAGFPRSWGGEGRSHAPDAKLERL